MNILNVTSIEGWRGGDAQMYTIYKLLERYTEINQYILCPETSVLAEKCKNDNSKYFTYTRKNKIKSLINPIKKIIKEQNIDILHIHDSSALSAAILAKIFSSNKSVRIIYSRKRNNRIKNNFFSKLKYNNNYVEQIICVSKAVEKIFIDIKINSNKLLTIYDAIDVAKFANKKSKNLIHQELNLDDDKLIIGNICSLTEQKDVKTFIETAKVIMNNYNSDKIEFVLIGDGELKEELKEFSLNLGLHKKIHFLGFRNNVNELLPELDLLLMTSITEGLPLSVYEAFASKVPIVSTKAGGIPEVIIDYETGFITEIKDVNKLSERVINILEDNDLRIKIINNAFHLVSSKFDLNNLEKNYRDYYTSLNNKL